MWQHYYFFRFAHPWVPFLLPVLPLLWWLRTKRTTRAYIYPCTQQLINADLVASSRFKRILLIMRWIALTSLLLAIARPQLVDERSKAAVEGINIMLVMDVSGSMSFPYDENGQRSRLEVAKEEACRFIAKRHHDAIGIVVFGNIACTRCPLTGDKKLLRDLVKSFDLDEIDNRGTVLARGILAAINRLKNSSAPTNIIILLTDGDPTENDIPPATVIDIAKQYAIKIYTIGIGSEKNHIIRHPFYGAITLPAVNKALLDTIAQQTGGHCFMAHNAADMRSIYEAIDQLEKSKQEISQFLNYYELCAPLLLLAFTLLCIELLLTTFVWFCV